MLDTLKSSQQGIVEGFIGPESSECLLFTSHQILIQWQVDNSAIK